MSDAELLEPPALSVETRAMAALDSTATEQRLKALAVKNVAITQVIDAPGRAQAHGAAMELKRTRVAIEATGKAAREDATKFSKAVVAEEKRLISIIEPEEIRLLKLRDDWDDAMAELKAMEERKEKARITAIHARISDIRGYTTLALECRTSERIQTLLDKMETTWLACDFEADFAEFGEEAQDVYNQAHQRLTAMVGQKKDEELERARIKAEQEAAAEDLRKQREELAAAQAEAKRIADAAEAKVRAAAQEMAAQRAAFEAEQEAARQTLVAQARQVAEDRAALEEAKDPEVKAVAEYAAAIAVDLLEPELLVLSGSMSIAMEPASPPVEALIQAVAEKFNVAMGTAAEWLTNAADEIAEFQ